MKVYVTNIINNKDQLFFNTTEKFFSKSKPTNPNYHPFDQKRKDDKHTESGWLGRGFLKLPQSPTPHLFM